MASLTGITEVPADFLPTRDDLVQVARAAGRHDATARTIRGWRDRRLISPPTRRAGLYRYPIAALAEVDGIVRWTRRGWPRERIAFARFIEANTLNSAGAVGACRALLEALSEGAAGMAALAAAGEHAIREEARKAARMRGRHAILPRRVRTTEQERVSAMFYLFSRASQVVVDPVESARGLFDLERVLGLRSGRGGNSRDLNELMAPVEELSTDPEVLVGALLSADSQMLALARRLVELECLWLLAAMQLIFPTPSPPDVAFLQIVAESMLEPTPEIYAGVFAHHVMLLTARRTSEEIAAALAEPEPAMLIAMELDGRPATETERLRPYQRVQLRLAQIALAGDRVA